VRWPCFYGIDFASRAELVAGDLDLDGVRRSIGADTLVTCPRGLIKATEQPASRLCAACFDGNYRSRCPRTPGRQAPVGNIIPTTERLPRVRAAGAMRQP